MNLVTNFLASLGLALAISTAAFAAPVLVTAADGTLLGANGVEVNGSFYDVTFGGGILGESITAFTTGNTALEATRSFVDFLMSRPLPISLRAPSGCDYIYGCNFTTPYLLFISDYEVPNVYKSYVQYYSVKSYGGSLTDVESGWVDSSSAWGIGPIARWTPSSNATAVPEPEAYAMLFAGLGVMGFMIRRKQM